MGLMQNHAPASSRLLRVWLIALLLVGLCPGGYGFVEDAVHLLQEGHLVDAHNSSKKIDDSVCARDDRDGGHDEHGCSGTFHTCGCHSAAFVVDLSSPALRLPVLLVRDSRFVLVDGGASADTIGFDRPPRA